MIKPNIELVLSYKSLQQDQGPADCILISQNQTTHAASFIFHQHSLSAELVFSRPLLSLLQEPAMADTVPIVEINQYEELDSHPPAGHPLARLTRVLPDWRRGLVLASVVVLVVLAAVAAAVVSGQDPGGAGIPVVRLSSWIESNFSIFVQFLELSFK